MAYVKDDLVASARDDSAACARDDSAVFARGDLWLVPETILQLVPGLCQGRFCDFGSMACVGDLLVPKIDVPGMSFWLLPR